MAKLTILIADDEDEVEVSCRGDTRIKEEPTPAQILADRLMRTAKQELKCPS